MEGQAIALLGALAAAGLAAGFVAGLFGVGGGLVIVPVLFHLFGALGVDEAVRLHAAIATALATIIATSLRALRTHQAAGAVDFAVLRAWTPWLAGGAVLGAALAGVLQTQALLYVFGFGVCIVAAQMAFADPAWRVWRDLPRGGARAGVAGGIGLFSAMMGIGGGAFGVTVMTLCGRPIHQAVATASGFGAAIAGPAVLAYIAAGWGRAGLPWGSIGFVNLPGFALLSVFTIAAAPYGARLAHRLDRALLRRLFAAFLVVVGGNLLWEAFAA